MPRYEIEVPGQGKYEVDSPVDLTDAQAYAAIQSQITAAPAKPKEDSPLFGSLQKGIVNTKQSIVQNQIASLADLQAADKEKYGETYQAAPASELEKISARDKALVDKVASLAEFGMERKKLDEQYGVNPLTKTIRDISASENYQKADTFDQLKMYGNALWEKKSDIPGYIASISLESLPQSIPMAAAALAARFGGMGPKGAAIAGGAGSSFTEFGNQYAELRAEGLDHKEAWEKAGVKSGVIGLFDAASFSSAGGAASTIMRNLEKGALKATAKETGKQIGVQALYGMAGEGLGSTAINQKVDPIQVIEEGLGEIAGAPIEAATTYQQKRSEAKAAEAKPTFETTAEGKVVPTPEPTPATPLTELKQAELFTPEEAPYQITPGETTAAERTQAEVERQIDALSQQEPTPEVTAQIEEL